jgi:hypothetical protein
MPARCTPCELSKNSLTGSDRLCYNADYYRRSVPVIGDHSLPAVCTGTVIHGFFPVVGTGFHSRSRMVDGWGREA